MPQSNRVLRQAPLGLILLSAACNAEEPRPDTGRLPTASALGVSQHASPVAASASAAGAPLASPRLSVADFEVNENNAWARCYRGFQASGHAERDVVRLSTLCGPITGMQASGPRFSGALTEGGSAVVRVDLGQECVRVVGGASAGVEALEVELFNPKGESLALVNLGQPWALLPADKPICMTEEGTYSLRLSTQGVQGQYALRVLRYWPTGKEPASSP